MTHYLRLVRALVIVASIIPHSRAQAQRDDAEWLAQCNNDRYNRRERFCEVRQQRVRAPGGTIRVDGLRNGGVSVIGASRDSLIVTTRLQVQARTQSEAREIARQVRTVIRGSTIETEGPRTDYDDDDTSWSANLIVWAPRRSDLQLSAHNGPISVEDISGDMELETHNGPLSLRELSGNVRARTTNGPLSITLSGSKWTGSGLDAETHNGPLSLRIPEGYSAHLEAGTENGPMSLGFPVTMVGRIGKNISTDLGSGGTTIRAITHNGPLSIEHR